MSVEQRAAGRGSEGQEVSLLRRIMLLAIGVGVLTGWLAAVVAVAIFLAWVWPAFVGVGVGLILALGLYVARPRLPRLPKDAIRLERGNAPELFRLVDEICDELEAPKVRILAVDGEINASTLRVGVRRHLAIVIGLPLWVSLERQERLALLSHEVAHAVNGDIRRSAIVGSSIDILAHWHLLTYPGSFRAASDRGVAEALAWLLVAVPHGALELLVRWQVKTTLANQRWAEFEADRLAAMAAGSANCTALMEHGVLLGSVPFAVKRAVRDGDADTWGAIVRRRAELPEDERAAIREAAMREGTSIDETHPPFGQRIEALEQAVQRSPAILYDSQWNDRVDRELDNVKDELEPQVRANLSRPDAW